MGDQIRTLPVTLNDVECADRAKELVALMGRRDSEIADQLAAKQSMRARIKGMDADIEKLAKTVRERREDRPVPCFHTFDGKAGTARLVRSDTEEIVETRPMTPDEKQRSLFELNEEEKRKLEDLLRQAGEIAKAEAENEAAEKEEIGDDTPIDATATMVETPSKPTTPRLLALPPASGSAKKPAKKSGAKKSKKSGKPKTKL